MAQLSSIALNIKQNRPDFKLDPLKNQPPLFKFKYLSKTLDPPKENPEDPNNCRTVTVKCLYKGCR
jgi:hypothetical protein